MGRLKLRGVVIAERENGESGKRLTLLVKGVGKVVLTARGAKNTKSKLMAGTQLFTYADFMVWEGRGFYSLTQVDIIESFYNIRMDVERLAEAVYITELMEKTCLAGMEQDEALRLLLHALQMLERANVPPQLISRAFEIKYLQISGFLSLEECMLCGDALPQIFFHEVEGLFICYKHPGGKVLLPAVQKALLFVVASEGKRIFSFMLSPDALEQLDWLCRRYIRVHMGVELKSREYCKKL